MNVQELKKLVQDVYHKDEVWGAELHEAFGLDAEEHRFDLDKSKHPAAANAAHAELWEARDRFNRAGGYAALLEASAKDGFV